MFVDEVRIYVRAGAGGAGVASFRRVKGRPRGKPEGGSGGAGGDVWVAADSTVASLLAFSRHPHHAAGSGTHGEGELRHGRDGEDLILAVPLGTIVRDEDGTMIADLVESGQRVRVAEGGRGGRGNASFVGPRYRAPSFAEQGEYGEERALTLELKLLADAALIGFPNSGKSTLIGKVSASQPEIAPYPFTTLRPHLGVVEVGDREFVLADIPGLIEGAADGKGLGHEFLRHTERARVLVCLLDPSPLQETAADDQYRVLVRELERHSSTLGERPRLVAVNKMDLPGAADKARDLEPWATGVGHDLYEISAVTGQGVDRLMYAVADEAERIDREGPGREGYVLHRPREVGFSVGRDGETWVVTGKAAERAIALADLTQPEAADFASGRLTRLGIEEALARAGAVPGDDVRIGDIVFEYQPEAGDEATTPEGESP